MYYIIEKSESLTKIPAAAQQRYPTRPDGVNHDTKSLAKQKAFIAGANWQKEQDDTQTINLFKERIMIARLFGEYKGTLKGILHWDLPSELREKIKDELIRLEKAYQKYHNGK